VQPEVTAPRKEQRRHPRPGTWKHGRILAELSSHQSPAAGVLAPLSSVSRAGRGAHLWALGPEPAARPYLASMNGPGSDASALSLPATHRAVRRRFSGAICSVLAAAAVLVAGLWSVSHFHAVSDGLRRDGGRTPGQITVVTRDGKSRVGDAQIDYVVSGRALAERLDLTGHDGRYRRGQQVTVFYDRADPRRMTVGGQDNRPEWFGEVLVDGTDVDAAFALGGVGLGLNTLVKRRRLASRSWRTGPASVTSMSNSRVYVTFDDPAGSDGGGVGRAGLGGGPQSAATDVLTCGAGRRFVLGLNGGRTLMDAKQPRGARQADRWKRRVAERRAAAGLVRPPPSIR